jgi:ribonuclease HII
MVYAVAYCPVARQKELKELGVDGIQLDFRSDHIIVKDSKGLTEETREELFGLLKTKGDWIGYSIHIGTPQVSF